MRKNQRLINFHTSGLTSMPVASDVHYGEIVVRHNEQQPELLIKVSESKFGVIPGSGAVASAISVAVTNVTNYIDGEVDTIESSITELRTAVSAVSTNIGENYVSKTDFETAQGDLFTSATTVASDDATAKANNAKSDAIAAAAASATTLLGLVDAVDDKVDADVKALADYKTEVSNTYATKADVTSAIATAKSEAIDAAAADATTKADAAEAAAIAAAAASADTLNKSIEAVDDRVDAVSGNLNTFKTDVARTYATKTGVTSDIKDAKDSVYSSATTAAAADATTKADAAEAAAIAAAAASADTLNKSIEAVDRKVDALSGNVETAIQNLETGLTETINKKVATAYRYQKTVTNYADLPTSEMSEVTVGYVYNVENANGNYPAGTNYAWNGTKWDALGGSVDLSPYALKTEVTASADTLNKSIKAVSASLDTFKTTVASTYATKTGVTSDITAAKTEVYTSATTAAATDAKEKADAAQTAAINAAAASANTLQNNINTVNNSVTGLSASTANIETTANSAIQTASIVDSATCKVSVSKDKTELKFDFSNLVIDCGDF